MKSILICAAALALGAGPALAAEVVIEGNGPEVHHRSIGVDVERDRTISHDRDGCDSKTMTRTNEEGDTTSKTVTRC